MQDLSRRKLLSSIAVAPLVGAAVSRAAAQTGIYGYGPPPKAPAVDNGTPAHFETSCSLPPPTAQTLRQMSDAARERIHREHFPDVILRTQDNQKVRFYTDLVKDKVVVLNFFYTNCEGICPGVIANLAKMQKLFNGRVGRELFMYSLTLKPEHDNPQVLKEYAGTFNVGPGWTFLTGEMDDIDAIRRGVGFAYSDPVLDRDKSQHIGNIRYGNEPLMLWAACPGMTHPSYLVKEISYVIRPEAKKSRAGSKELS
jgi:protein SCO1/2